MEMDDIGLIAEAQDDKKKSVLISFRGDAF
jgi:hypothetical protein